jgi:hypothetical protein
MKGQCKTSEAKPDIPIEDFRSAPLRQSNHVFERLEWLIPTAAETQIDVAKPPSHSLVLKWKGSALQPARTIH